jgi:hypothetical protein
VKIGARLSLTIIILSFVGIGSLLFVTSYRTRRQIESQLEEQGKVLGQEAAARVSS